MHALYRRCRTLGLLDGVCRACSKKMGILEAAGGEGLLLMDDMNGHPGMGRYLEDAFEVITKVR